jgi:hypothetical protein
MSEKEFKRKKFRMDFLLEKAEPVQGESNVFKFVMRPDPRIWEVIKKDGKEAWYNKIDRILIPMDEFKKAVENMKGIPIVASNIEVEGIKDYVLKSKKRVEKEIQEERTE